MKKKEAVTSHQAKHFKDMDLRIDSTVPFEHVDTIPLLESWVF